MNPQGEQIGNPPNPPEGTGGTGTPPPEPTAGEGAGTVPQEQYAGMQRKYNHLFNQFNEEKAAREQAQSRISELELQVSQLGTVESSLQDQISKLSQDIQEKENVLAQLSREKAKVDLVKSEFPDMVSFIDLVPEGDEEAMRSHFKLLSERLTSDAQQRAQAALAGTTPQVGGTRGQPPDPSLDELWGQLETLDPTTMEYRKVADLYAAKRFQEQNKEK